jgi:hypothetical protein
MEIKNYSRRHINAIVQNQDFSSHWKFTGFYGHPDPSKRHEGWEILKHLAGMTPKAWVCIGDFNKVITLSEKFGGNERQSYLIQAFRQTLEECELTDLGFYGPKYTWSNCQEGDSLIQERLDRGVANLEWRNFFPEAEIVVSTTTNSDHAPLFLNLRRSQYVVGYKQ